MLGDKVYIRPEYIDFVNPLIGDDSINYKIWNVMSTSKEVPYSRNNGEIYGSYQCYTIECDGFVIKDVRENFLMDVAEDRDKKIQQIMN